MCQPCAEGLGAAIKLGRQFVGEDPLAVLLSDDLYLCGTLTFLIVIKFIVIEFEK